MNFSEAKKAVQALKLESAAHGFLLCDVKSISSLPDSVWLNDIPDQYQAGSLLVLAHAGKKFWEIFSRKESEGLLATQDPVDNYSATLSEQVIDNHLEGVSRQQLYPISECPINLMALGKAFGWHAPSPLGMGMHQKYGLWSAYRAVWWLDIDVPKSFLTKASDVCVSCQTQDCVSACPAEAITLAKNPNLSSCADYRLQGESLCASTCLSRMACPQASEHRYTDTQMAYHYELARSAIAKYRSQ